MWWSKKQSRRKKQTRGAEGADMDGLVDDLSHDVVHSYTVEV